MKVLLLNLRYHGIKCTSHVGSLEMVREDMIMAIVEHICRPELFSTLGDPFLNSFRNLHSIYRLSDIMLRNYLRQQRKELVSDRETLQQLGHIVDVNFRLHHQERREQDFYHNFE